MPAIACPHCQKTFNVPDQYIGKTVRCAACKKPFAAEILPELEAESETPWMNAGVTRKAPRAAPPVSEVSGPTTKRVVLAAVEFGFIGLLLGAAIGVYLSQYQPIFGGFAIIGEPWSPIRQTLIGVHVVACGGVLGIVLAGVAVGCTYLDSSLSRWWKSRR